MFFAWGDTFDAVSFLKEYGLSWESGYCDSGFFQDERRPHDCVVFCPRDYNAISTERQICSAEKFFLDHHAPLSFLKLNNIQMRLSLSNRTTIDTGHPGNLFKTIVFPQSFILAALPFLSSLDMNIYVDAVDLDQIPLHERELLND